jgi:hypothetical protein
MTSHDRKQFDKKKRLKYAKRLEEREYRPKIVPDKRRLSLRQLEDYLDDIEDDPRFKTN